MAPNYHSSSTAGIPVTQVTEYLISPAALPPTLPPAGSGPLLGPGQYSTTSPSPASSYTEHGPEVVGLTSMTPPPAYTESDPRVIVADSKTLPRAYDLPLPSSRSDHNSDEGGTSLCVRAPEEPSSLQVGAMSSAPMIRWIFILNTYADTEILPKSCTTVNPLFMAR